MTIYALEYELNDKLKSLGFLCYNKYVDSVVVISGVDELLSKIKNDFYRYSMLRNDNADEESIREQEEQMSSDLIELGCACFSIYVDGRMENLEFIPLCEDVSFLSSQIANARLNQPMDTPVESSQNDGQSIVFDSSFGNNEVIADNVDSENNCPYGMEPIPKNFIKCSCRYKNREDAVFCAKCGTKFR